MRTYTVVEYIEGDRHPVPWPALPYREAAPGKVWILIGMDNGAILSRDRTRLVYGWIWRETPESIIDDRMLELLVTPMVGAETTRDKVVPESKKSLDQ